MLVEVIQQLVFHFVQQQFENKIVWWQVFQYKTLSVVDDLVEVFDGLVHPVL